MGDPHGVRGIQRVGDFDAERQQRLAVETAMRRNALLQRGALQILHGDEGAALLFADVMNRANVGMIQRRRGPGLALKTVQRLGVASQSLGDELEGDKAMKPRVFRLVHDPHAAGAKLLDDEVVGDRLADICVVAAGQTLRLVAGHHSGGDLNRRP